jgi:hypothetical protein
VRGDSDVRAALEQHVERSDEVVADFLVPLVGDELRLEVDPLAQADVRPQLGERADVPEGAAEARLQDDADVVVAARA